jgi:hypothetical protein
MDSPDVKVPNDILSPGFLRHELRGPNAEVHLWMFDDEYQLISDPSHDDLPRSWPIIAGITLGALETLGQQSPIF